MVIAFPFAGGNKYSYNAIFGRDRNFLTLEYPGRGARSSEKLMTDVDTIVDDALDQVLPHIRESGEYVLYGHSMGALIAFLVSRKIEESGFRRPSKLVVSGRNAPSHVRVHSFSMLDDQAFVQKLARLGGIPLDFLQQPALLQYFIPAMRADILALEKFRHCADKKLTVPIDVLLGMDDPITKNIPHEWAAETTANTNFMSFSGDHFFIFGHREYLRLHLLGSRSSAGVPSMY